MIYIAVSSNIALEGSNGGPEKYELFMKYGAVPTPNDYDVKSSLTASDSYVGTVLYRYITYAFMSVLLIIISISFNKEASIFLQPIYFFILVAI